MFNRKDYIENKVCTHEEYYRQFVTPLVKARVSHLIDRARKSTDPHFNDIPLKLWDNCLTPCPAEINKLMRECGDYPTASGLVCIGKLAVRDIIKGDLERAK